jgi:transposase-like protein
MFLEELAASGMHLDRHRAGELITGQVRAVALEAGELTPRQVAQLTGVSTGTIHYWINAGYLTARRGPAGRWCIPFPPEVQAACRERAAGSAHQHRDTGPAPRREQELSIADAARRLGVKPDVIYNWAQRGHIPARRGAAGRLWIDFTPAVQRACLQRIASSYKLPEAINTQAAQRMERKAV